MTSIIKGFFQLINREAAKFNADPESYELKLSTFEAIFWRIEAVANPVGGRATHRCAAWLQNVYEHYLGSFPIASNDELDYLIETVVYERASELLDGGRPYAIEGWFVKN